MCTWSSVGCIAGSTFYYGMSCCSFGKDHPSFLSNVVISVIIAAFLVVGSIGSLTTAVVIGKNKQLHTKANIFILSLCISDLLSALICSPLWLYRRTWGFQYWYLDESVCQFYWIVDYSTNYLTSLHIVSFSALRYAAIKWPFVDATLTKRNIACYVLLLWLISTVSASPLGFLMGVDLERVSDNVGSFWPSCSIATREGCCVDQYKIYIMVLNPAMFYIPQFFILVFSILITLEIRKNTRRRQSYFANRTSRPFPISSLNRNQLPETITNHHAIPCGSVSGTLERNNNNIQASGQREHHSHESLFRTPSGTRETGAYLQLILIVIVYCIGYLPTTVYLQWTTAVQSSYKTSELDYWFGVVSYLTLRLAECMNPFMYNIGSSTLRKETKRFFRKLFCVDS